MKMRSTEIRGVRVGMYLTSALAAACVPATAAWAQNAATSQPSPTEPDSGNGLTEIVVTAQKRAQNLQDVPVAITALTAASIQANRITNVVDLNGLAPGFIARQSAGAAGIASFTMRGVTSYGSVPGSDKEVSIYLDGVYISASRASMFDLPDIERIEVLRGPQGTLFGRNSTAGAVSVVTRDPTGKFGVMQDFTGGNYGQFRSRTSVDLPTVGPFSAYVTFTHNQRRGDIRNLGAGTVWDRTGPGTNVGVQTSPEWLGSHNTNSEFAAVKFEPSSSLKMIYKFDHSVDHFTPDGEAAIAYNPGSASVGGFLSAVLATQDHTVLFNPQNTRPDAVNNSFAVPGVQRNTGHSLTSTLQLAPHLSVRNIAAYRDAFITSGTQLDGLGGLKITAATAALIPAYAPLIGSNFLVTASNAQSHSQQWSDETQFNYDSQLVTLTVGGIYFHSKDRAGGPPGIRNTFAFVTIPASGRIPLGSEATSYNEATSYAGYAQAEVHITPQLDAVLGGRITHDDKSGTFVTGGTYVSTTPGSYTDGTFVGQKLNPFTYSKTKPTYSLGLNYKPSRAILVYGKYSTGFVSGGSVGGVLFAPETVSSWEGGVKADLLDRRLRANLAVYAAKYEHLQTAQGGVNVGHPELGSVIIDNGGLRAKGADIELTAEPIDRLTLNGSLGYTDAHLTNPNPIVIASSLGEAVVTLQPKWTSNLSAQYETHPLFNDAHLIFRLDATWRSKMRFDPNPNIATLIPAFAPFEYSPAAWVLNARIALQNVQIAGTDVQIALWSRNLNDNKAPVYGLGFSDYSRSASYQQARTFGIDVNVKY